MTSPEHSVTEAPSASSPREVSEASSTPPAQAGPELPSNGAWRLLAWLAPILCLAVNVYVLWGTTWPAFPFDEVTLLQMSRMIAGEDVVVGIRGGSYFPGWAVLVAPVWWFTSDPSVAYQASLWLGLIPSMATIWPLAGILRRFDLATAPAVVAASFAMILPARAIQADFSLSERLVTLLVVGAVLAAFRVAERPTLARHAVFAGVLGLLFFAHVRMSVVLIAAAVWLVIRLVRHRVPSAAGLALVALAYLAANWAGNALNEALIGRSVARGDDLLQRIGDSRPDLFLRVGIGQSWYQSLASFGVIAVGLVVVLVLVWRELRRWDFGGATFLLGATAVVVFVSLAQWANDFLLFIAPLVRLDGWIYGRYIDPVATVLTAIGAAVLLKGVSRAVGAWAVGMHVAVAAMAFGYLTREVPTWGFVTPAHVPGVLPWRLLLPTEPWPRDVGIVPTLVNENRIWIIAPLCVLAVLLLAYALRRRPVWLASGLVVLAAVATVLSVPRSETFHRDEAVYLDMRERVESVAPIDEDLTVGYQRGCERPSALDAPGQNYFGYALLPAEVPSIERSSELEDVDLVVACDVWTEGERLGARRVDGPSVFASQLWVMPGTLQDELETAGRLAPAGP